MRELKWVAEGGAALDSAASTTSLAVPRSAWSRTLPWAMVATLSVALLAGVVVWSPWRSATPPHVTRTTITPSGPAAHIDSIALGEIIGAYTSVTCKSGTLKLLNVTARVHELLVITKLLSVFDLFDAEAEAVQSFGVARIE